MKKRTFLINGVEIKTVGCADTARKAYNRKNPGNKIGGAKDAWQFKEVR
jgi:hypothetical protein